MRITISSPDLGRLLSRLENAYPTMSVRLRKATMEASGILLTQIRANIPSARHAPLRRSWKQTVPEKEEGVWTVFLESDHPRAEFRETGGTVKAGVGFAKCGPNAGKRTTRLAIPLPGTGLTASGLPKGGPCSISDLRFIPGRNGKNPVLAKRMGSKANPRWVAYFALPKQVTVGPYPYYGPAIKSTASKRREVFKFHMAKALSGKA